MKRVEWRHISVYKNCIANKENFAAKILWSVDSFVQLFLEDCRKCTDQEDVNQGVIDFKLLDMDIALFKFHIELPSCFHKKTIEWRDKESMAEKKEGEKGGKCKSNVKDDGKKNDGQKRAGERAVNETQLDEFKMAKGETWEKTFQGKCPKKCVKWLDTFMCPHYHTKGICWEASCKYAATHKPASEIPEDKRGEYKVYLLECRKEAVRE